MDDYQLKQDVMTKAAESTWNVDLLARREIIETLQEVMRTGSPGQKLSAIRQLTDLVHRDQDHELAVVREILRLPPEPAHRGGVGQPVINGNRVTLTDIHKILEVTSTAAAGRSPQPAISRSESIPPGQQQQTRQTGPGAIIDLNNKDRQKHEASH